MILKRLGMGHGAWGMGHGAWGMGQGAGGREQGAGERNCCHDLFFEVP